jgi:hypothetical protein
MKRLLVLVFVLAAILFAGAAQATDYVKVSDIQPGMKAYGLSVFRGTEPERFDVEVLGISSFPRLGPKVFVRVSGGPENIINRCGTIIAGISGSPIYTMDGKLIGALAYGPNYGKEPIGAVTPFEHMKAESDAYSSGAADGASPGPLPWQGKTFVPLPLGKVHAAGANPFVSEQLNQFVPQLALGVGSSAQYPVNGSKRFVPGSAISVAIADGDNMFIFATGTVTAVDGDKLYAFGHPFMGEGEVSYPAWQTNIVAVIPDYASSFKENGDERYERAAITYDGKYGIYGTIGVEPKMVPVEITVTLGNSTKNFNYRVIYGRLMTAVLRSIVGNFLDSDPEIPNDVTLSVEGRIVPVGHREVYVRDVLVRDAHDLKPMMMQAMEMKYIDAVDNIVNHDKNIRFENLHLTFSAEKGVRLFSLEKVYVSADKVAPGTPVEFTVAVVESGDLSVQRSHQMTQLKIQLPKDVPLGTAEVYVDDAGAFKDMRLGSKSEPTSTDELIKKLNDTSANSSRLYLTVIFPEKMKSACESAVPLSGKPEQAVHSGERKEEVVETTCAPLVPLSDRPAQATNLGERKEEVAKWKESESLPATGEKERVQIFEISMPVTTSVVRGSKHIKFDIVDPIVAQAAKAQLIEKQEKPKKGFLRSLFGK